MAAEAKQKAEADAKAAAAKIAKIEALMESMPAPGAQVVDDPAYALASFGASHFKRAYAQIMPPEHQDELLGAVRHIVQAYATSHEVSRSKTKQFINELYGEWGGLAEPIKLSAQKVWTSLRRLGGAIEFCSIFGETVREDRASLAPHSALLARAINANNVSRVGPDARAFPKGKGAAAPNQSTEAAVCWRGGGFRDTADVRAFFTVGRPYRVAQFLATSFDATVAERFIGFASMGPFVNARVLWKVKLDAAKPCQHVNLLTGDKTHVQGEAEYLFAAFSAFTVEKVEWSDEPQNPATPHEITIRAAPDNAAEPEDLPLAPWC